MHKHVTKFYWLFLLLGLVACGILPRQSSPATQPPEPTTQASPSPTPDTGAQGGTIPEPTTPPTTIPLDEPTRPPLMSAWPLAADLYYLNDAQQVWRQSALGDESAAAAVTALDLAIFDFAIAPGGDWMAYRTEDAVAVRSMDGLSGQLVASDIGAPQEVTRGRTIAWSPDGSKLAYTTNLGFQAYVTGAGADFTPMIFNVPEAPLVDLGWSQDSRWLLAQRADGTAVLYVADPTLSLWVELGRVNGYAWLEDGRLAFAPVEGGLALLDPQDLNSRVFMVPQDRQITLPGQQTDGTLVFFAHDESVEQPGFLYSGDPEDLSFSPESAVPVNTARFHWNPTTSRLIGQDEPDEKGETVTLLDPATGSQATFEASGRPLKFDWGAVPPQTSTGAVMPSHLYFLAAQAGLTQVWRLPSNGEPPEPITNAADDVMDFDISRDGTQVVYSSGGVIYRQVINTLDVNEVFTLFEGVEHGYPAFSPSGRQIAFASRGIWIIDLDEGEPYRLVQDVTPETTGSESLIQTYGVPRWSPDGERLLIDVGFYEGFDIALLAVTEPGTGSQPVFLSLYGARAVWTSDGRILAFSEGGPYATPMLALIRPGEEPSITTLLEVPIIDAHLRTDGRISLLRTPGPYGLGPTSARIFSAQIDGSNLQAESRAYLLDSPILAPNAVLIAGLIRGQLAVVNPGTGDVYIIEGMSHVRDLKWGR